MNNRNICNFFLAIAVSEFVYFGCLFYFYDIIKSFASTGNLAEYAGDLWLYGFLRYSGAIGFMVLGVALTLFQRKLFYGFVLGGGFVTLIIRFKLNNDLGKVMNLLIGNPKLSILTLGLFFLLSSVILIKVSRSGNLGVASRSRKLP